MNEHGDRGPPPHPKKPGVVRIWMDGCFDMMHFGHANAMRQARMLGYELAGGPPTDDERERFARCELYVGVHTDEEVDKFKSCLPCMTAEERYAAVRAVKWVTHVVEEAPYVTDMADVERYDIDYVVHGDDLSVDLNGNDSYAAVKAAGKMKLVKRTEGVSTTDIISRMLMAAKIYSGASASGAADASGAAAAAVVPASLSTFVATTRKIALFSSGRQPVKGDKVVYVHGAFDLFHLGHVSLLRKAKEEGSFVVVGVESDAAVTSKKGSAFPIMNVFERTLSVAACRYVDEVVMGVGPEVTKKVLEGVKADIVICGDEKAATEGAVYSAAREGGLVKAVSSGSSLSSKQIIERVLKYEEQLVKRQAAKKEKDKSLYTARSTDEQVADL